MALPRFQPMLASGGPIPGSAEEWSFEPKLDGWRVLVYVDGDVTVRSRNGRDITESVPELRALGDAVREPVVLDGELVAHEGRPHDFYRLGPRLMARSSFAPARTTPVTFVAFDVLYAAGDVTGERYVDRRRRLEDLELHGRSWCTAPSFEGAGAELFAACVELELEGLMAKRLDSRYYPGERRRVWVKAKTVSWKTTHAGYRTSR